MKKPTFKRRANLAHNRKVVCFEGEDIIQIYNSATEAAKAIIAQAGGDLLKTRSGIYTAISRGQSFYRYHWKYLHQVGMPSDEMLKPGEPKE